jgi:GntR family transcriptional regulator
MSRQPAYSIVYQDIKEKIGNGEYMPGDLLPTEPNLENEFSVSRTTIRKAIDLLSKDGYVSTQQGRGTEVLNPRTTQKLNFITSFSATLESQGGQVDSKGTHIDFVSPPKNVAKKLMIEEHEEVVRVQRVQCYNGKPLCIMTNYLKKTIAPDLPFYTGSFVSLYQLLLEKYNIAFDSAEERISADNSNFTEAQVLDVPVGTALLVSNRTSYLSGQPVAFANLKIIGNKYNFYIYLVGKDN